MSICINSRNTIQLLQIENEYNHIQLAYEEKGDSYVQWAANMAVALDAGVPWIMCKQKDAPDPVVSYKVAPSTKLLMVSITSGLSLNLVYFIW